MNMLIGSLLVAALLGAGVYFYLQRQRQADTPASAEGDRYVAEETISPGHAKLLLYLQEAFPGRAVLFRPTLAQLVSVRLAADRQRALRRLHSHSVDYVVCTSDGKAEYAFDVRERNTDTDEAARRANALKSRVLKTAGVRLLRIHRSVSSLPPVHEFQQRLAESLGQSSARAPSAAPAQPSLSSDTPPSNMASLTDLMGLPPEADTPSPR
ncbi:MAG: DUF2726 domain-containing protein [Pseudomonadota bacterium]|nr:DUF2726 domain-containing protein [Pseudomonadota bacterium]